MNLDAVRRIADAVLYEGYILYPYRASAQKNRSRWQFGVLMPPAYTAVDPSERAFAQSECVLEHDGRPVVEVVVRLLQVQRRQKVDREPPGPAGPSWDEAVESEITVTVGAAELLRGGCVRDFTVTGGEDRAPVTDASGGPAGHVIRRRERLTGVVSVLASPVPGPWRALRLQVRVENRTAQDPAPRRRDEALPSALVAVHMIVGVRGGQFISMTDPPEWARPAVQACLNTGCWPVLADPDGGRQVMLSTPIILYDYPELAPESPGDLYDGTEIDEILSLRTLALSDAEKLEARATDPRAAALIDRVESLDARDFERMHGTIRAPRGAAGFPSGDVRSPERPATPDPAAPWWDPGADASVSPDTDAVTIGGHRIARGSRVTLRPGVRRSDAQDMFLAGRAAVVEAVLLDVDDNPYLAVSLADDPDYDLRSAHGRFLYFAPDEVEPDEAAP
ncbi:MAG: hypothetical protein ACRDOI_38870 [Trebonia sp.]